MWSCNYGVLGWSNAAAGCKDTRGTVDDRLYDLAWQNARRLRWQILVISSECKYHGISEVENK